MALRVTGEAITTTLTIQFTDNAGTVTNFNADSTPTAKVYLGDTLTQNQNGIWEIEYAGLNYFQVSGRLTELNERYVINGVPLIEANFDSDYWVLFDTLMFQIPMYSYLGWFSDQSMNTPISIGPYTYTMVI